VKRSGRSILPWIYGGTVAAHLAFGAVTALLPTPERSESVAIELADIKKKKEPPKPPPPQPPPPKEEKPKPPPRPAAQSQAKIAAEQPKLDSLPPMPEVGADGFADLGGVSLGGAGGEGVPMGTAPAAVEGPARAQGTPKATSRRVEQLAAAATGGCAEPVVKPRAKKPGQVKYTKEAQIAEIEGVVRVQVTVDESGKVVAAHVLSGLGYGLDEIALAAANATLFDPATLCGRPLVGTKILPFRFQLQ
jgi:protein TonB